MRAKLGCSAPRGPAAGTQGREMSWLRNLRTRLKTLWMTFMTGAALSVSRPLGTQAAAVRAAVRAPTPDAPDTRPRGAARPRPHLKTALCRYSACARWISSRSPTRASRARNSHQLTCRIWLAM